MVIRIQCHYQLPIDDLHISHNASGMEANIRVHLICNSSSHSSLVVNGLELLCVAATLCLYETRITKVIRSCTFDAEVTPQQSKIQPFLDILDKRLSAKIFPKGL